MEQLNALLDYTRWRNPGFSIVPRSRDLLLIQQLN